MKNDIKELPLAEIKRRIKKKQAQLQELCDELENRELDARHAEIDNLATYMDETDVSIATLIRRIREMLKKD